MSLDAAGQPIDLASAPGDGATQADPFVIDPNGSVDWEGSTDTVITNATWSVTVAGVPFLSGEFENANETTMREGVQTLAGLPGAAGWALDTAMVIPVSGTLTGDGGSCTASGWITGIGNPTASPLFYVGGALAVLGISVGAGALAGTRVVPSGGAMA